MDKDSLFDTGEYDKLLSKNKIVINISAVVNKFNNKSSRKGKPQIKLNCTNDLEEIYIPIGNYFATDLLCNNFILTLCENILRHGKPDISEHLNLSVSIDEYGFDFSNEAKTAHIIRNDSLTGNLNFLDNLFNGIKPGSFVITFPKPDEKPLTYKVRYNY